MQIASVNKQNVPTTYAQSESGLNTARVGTVDQSGNEKELDQQTYAQNNTPTEQPRTMAENTPPTAPPDTPPTAPPDETADRQATPQTLPHTASQYPLLALIGLLSIAAFTIATIVAKRMA